MNYSWTRRVLGNTRENLQAYEVVMNWERIHLNWGDAFDMICDLQHSQCCLDLLEKRPRTLSHAFLWEENVLGQPQICCNALNRKRFWVQVVHNRKMRWKWYINARILFVGCIEIHNLSVCLCSWWNRRWTFRYMHFSNVNTTVSAAGFTWESVGWAACCTIWIMLHEMKCKNCKTTW